MNKVITPLEAVMVIDPKSNARFLRLGTVKEGYCFYEPTFKPMGFLLIADSRNDELESLCQEAVKYDGA